MRLLGKKNKNSEIAYFDHKTRCVRNDKSKKKKLIKFAWSVCEMITKNNTTRVTYISQSV